MSLQLVPVNVCGQQLHASLKCSQGQPSLQILKETVENGVGMQQDWVQFFDTNGTKLLADEEVSLAIIDGRTPIYATVADSSVHNFEQRREEFAHMQWKVMRDQFTVLNLQQAHTQEQLKTLQKEMKETEQEQIKKMTSMMNQLADGLFVMKSCRESQTHTENFVKTLHDSVTNLDLKVSEETMRRDTLLQDVEFKLDRQNTVQQHETAKLANAFDQCLNLLQQADGQLKHDVEVLEKTMESTRDLANAQHDEVLKLIAEIRSGANVAISDASSSLLKQAHDEADRQVNELANKIAKFETRIVHSENLASDTAKRWLASHEQLKGQYNSMLQTVEQCRLQNRTNQASAQEVRDKLGIHAQVVEAQAAAMKAEQARERKDRQEQMKNMQQNLDGTLKLTIAELESKLRICVDKEADTRTASIRRALDEIGTVLEKELPTKGRPRSPLRAASASARPRTPGTPVTPRPTAIQSIPLSQTPISGIPLSQTRSGTSTPRAGQSILPQGYGVPVYIAAQEGSIGFHSLVTGKRAASSGSLTGRSTTPSTRS